MLTCILAAPSITLLDTHLFFAEVKQTVALPDRRDVTWLNFDYRDSSIPTKVVFPSMDLFLQQESALRDHAFPFSVLVICSTYEVEMFGVTPVVDTTWSDALVALLSVVGAPPALSVVKDVFAECKALKYYPAGQVMRDAHSALYRIPDKEVRAEVQREVWGWLGGSVKDRPRTIYPYIQRILERPEAVALRQASQHLNTTGDMDSTLRLHPAVDEFPLLFIRSTLNPKKRKVPTTEQVTNSPKRRA